MKQRTGGSFALALMLAMMMALGLALAPLGAAWAQQGPPAQTDRPGPISDDSEDWLDSQLEKNRTAGFPGVVEEIRKFTCPDPRTGAPIGIVGVPGMDNLAQARRLPGGALVIEYNPQYMKLFHAPTVLFWLEHECEHHQLGHTLDNNSAALTDAQRAREEDAADCAAAKTLVTSTPPKITAADLKVIEDDVRKLKGGGFYKTGPERAQWIDQCVAAGVQEVQARQQGAMPAQ